MLRLAWIKSLSALAVSVVLAGCPLGGDDDDDEEQQQEQEQETTFTVGGTITGLTAGSVVLRLNGSNDKTISAPGGSFTFDAVPLTNGTNYSVAMFGQSAALAAGVVCGPNVVNAGGTINGANVTNVSITCGTYGVGGTVTGLTATDLELEVLGAAANGANVTTVAASGSFAFPAALRLPSVLYSVHIKKQPTGQTCTVKDSSGVLLGVAPDATTAAVQCVGNDTDPLAGTYRVETLDGQPVDIRGFLTFYPDGTYIFGLHEDSADCGTSGHGGIEYGVYRWDETTHDFEIVNAVIDTNGECGVAELGAPSDFTALVANPDGTLTLSAGDATVTLAPVPSTANELIGSWGDNQAFAVYESTGKYFVAMTRSIVQSSAASPGIEDGCYTRTGNNTSGTLTLDLGANCSVSATQTAVDTSGPSGTSGLAGATLSFTVTGDSLQITLGGGDPIPFVPGTRIVASMPPASMWTVGGTISGLTGSGLGLRLNGQAAADFNVSPAAGATSFEFPARLASGEVYGVLVSTQPLAPTQFCRPTSGGLGTIGTSNVTNVVITCENSSSYSLGGTVSGLTGTGLMLRVRFLDGALGEFKEADLAVSANGAFTFPNPIAANSGFSVGVLAQPTGQGCTITRGIGFSLGAAVGNVGAACLDNVASSLRGTYSALNEDGTGRGYLNFNADGTMTTVLIHTEPGGSDPPADCAFGDPAIDARNGNGVEYGVFSWNSGTGAIDLKGPAAIDTSGDCGFWDPNGMDHFDGMLSRVGNTLEVRAAAGDPDPIVTATAVESVAGSLVGAWVPEAGNGSLLVFHADNTFMYAETQLGGLFPAGYGQERGCYELSGSSVTLSVAPACRPDGLAAYDLNSFGGLFVNANVLSTIGPVPFELLDADTLLFFGRVYKRTAPN